MKKSMIAITAALLVTTLAACQGGDVYKAKTPAPEVTKPAVSQTPPQSQPKQEDQGPLKKAFGGKIDGMTVGVGSRMQEVVTELGEPQELAHFEGTSYLSYTNMNFMLDKIVETTKDEARIIGISVFEGYELFGVKIGMTPEQIKQVLGAPNQEYMEDEEEGSMWKLEYICGDYKLTFYSDNKEAPTTAAYINGI